MELSLDLIEHQVIAALTRERTDGRASGSSSSRGSRAGCPGAGPQRRTGPVRRAATCPDLRPNRHADGRRPDCGRNGMGGLPDDVRRRRGPTADRGNAPRGHRGAGGCRLAAHGEPARHQREAATAIGIGPGVDGADAAAPVVEVNVDADRDPDMTIPRQKPRRKGTAMAIRELLDLAARVAELERRVSGMMRHGTVEKVDAAKARVRISSQAPDALPITVGPVRAPGRRAQGPHAPDEGAAIHGDVPGQKLASSRRRSDDVVQTKTPRPRRQETQERSLISRLRRHDPQVGQNNKIQVGGVSFQISSNSVTISSSKVTHDGKNISKSYVHGGVISRRDRPTERPRETKRKK